MRDRDYLKLNSESLAINDLDKDYDDFGRRAYDSDARAVKWLKDVLADEGAGRSSDRNRKRRAELAKGVR